MQNWNDLIYCLALNEYKTMSAAAKALRSNPTTVSRHIQRLSDTYKQPLFVKNGQEWRPTDLGERLSEVARSFKTNIESVDGAKEPEAAGTLRIYSSLRIMQGFLAEHWTQFLKDNPEINLEVSLYPSSLAFGEVDLIFSNQEPNEGRLVRKKVAKNEYAVFGAHEFVGKYEGWVEVLEQDGPALDQTYLSGRFAGPARLGVHGLNIICGTVSSLPLLAYLPVKIGDARPDLVKIPDTPTQSEVTWVACHESRRNDPTIRLVFDWLSCLS